MENNLLPRIKVIVGLGNPGKRYDGTWHNLGFEVVDLLARGESFRPGNGDYYVCQIAIESNDIALLKPTTFMNRSGIVVQQYALENQLAPPEILVIADDFNLPLGQIRLRRSGSDGGHKGLGSIIYHLMSDDFPRIRIGIGPVPENIPALDFVLEKIKQDDYPKVKQSITRAAEAVSMWLNEGFDNTAARFNRVDD